MFMLKRKFQTLFVLISSGVLFGGGFGCNANGGTPLIVGSKTPAGSTVLASTVVGSGGGTIAVTEPTSSFYQTQVFVPAGATSTPTIIAISDGSKVSGAAASMPAGLAAVGKPVELGPSGTVFSAPVEVDLVYTDADLAAAGITDESTLQVVTYAAGGSAFEYLPIAGHDSAGNRITARTTHFSFFQVAGATAGNRPSSATVAVPSGTLSGDITASATLADPDGDILSIAVDWARVADKSGASISPVVWNAATITGQTASLTPGTYSLTWHSASDAPLAGGDSYVLRVTPSDAVAMGIAGLSAQMTVDNTSGGGLPVPNLGWKETLTAFHSSGAPVGTGNPPVVGTGITLRLTLANNTGVSQTATYQNAQEYDFYALDASGTEVWRWSTGRAFGEVLGTRTVAAGQNLVHDVAWDFTDNQGNALAGGVSYTLHAVSSGASSPDAFAGTATLTLTPTAKPVLSGKLEFIAGTEDQSGNARTSFSPGETVVFKWTLTNGTNQSQTISYTGSCFQKYTYDVRDASGQVVWSPPLPMCAAPPVGQTTNATPDVLAPGASTVYTGTWTTSASTATGEYTARLTFWGSASPAVTPTAPDIKATLGSGVVTVNPLNGSLVLKDSTGKSVTSVPVGAQTTWELTLTNNTGGLQTLIFPTGQQYDFMVSSPPPPPGSMAPIALFWQWSNGRVFTQAQSTLTLAAGESRVFTASWNVTDNAGAALSPGSYEGHASVPQMATGAVTVGVIKPVAFTVTGTQSGVTSTLVARDAAGNVATSFAVGDPITLEYTVANYTQNDVTYNFTSGQQYDFEAVGAAGQRQWLWSTGRAFTQVIGSLTIKAGQTKVFTETWDQKDNAGAQVASGTHVCGAWLMPPPAPTPPPGMTIIPPPPTVLKATTQVTIGQTTGGDTTPPSFQGASSAQMYNGQLTVIATSVSWTAATDNVTPQSGITYNVYRYEVNPAYRYFVAPSMNYAVPYATVTGGQTGYMDTSVVTGQSIQYFYAVRAVDAAGNEDGNTKEVSVVVK